MTPKTQAKTTDAVERAWNHEPDRENRSTGTTISTQRALSPIRPARYRWYPQVKNLLERLFALLLMVPAGPMILFTALLVKITSRGPAFYVQTRLGKDGKTFTIYKLRTMMHKCESLTGPRWCIPGDPRITAVGHFLRWSHFDELPQLLNVLRGDMGLIGPRPERPEFLPELESAFSGYRQRLVVRPGVTGLAQVQLPADTDLDNVQKKLAYDLYYVKQLSPWLDLRILFSTGFFILGMPRGWVRRLLRVPIREVIEKEMKPYVGAQQVTTMRKAA